MRLIDADALKKRMVNEPVKAVQDVDFQAEWFTRIADTVCHMIDMVDEAPTVAAPRWHRCEEQLPPNDGKEVLVTDGFRVGIGICMYKWSKTKKWTQEAVWYKWNLNDYGYPMKKFKTDTHIKAWMPLPEPPKEGV